MLHDKYLPEYDIRTVHSITIRGQLEKPLSTLMSLDISGSLLIRLLYKLRGINSDENITGSLREMFIELERHGEHEIIFGLAGQFWKPDGNLQCVRADEFISFATEGFLKATWNFKSVTCGENQTIVETETRVKCYGAKARRKFLLYWFFVRPFSGMIRREILRLIERNANEIQ